MKSALFQRLKFVPSIVRIIVSQAARKRATGRVTEAMLAAQMDSLATAELEPRGLTLLVRHLPGNQLRFITKEKATGETCDTLDCGPDRTAREEMPLATTG